MKNLDEKGYNALLRILAVAVLIFSLCAGRFTTGGETIALLGSEIQAAELLNKGDNELLPPGMTDKVNINVADKTELISLPGIGEKLAERIIEHREDYGAFSSLEELKEVSGIGDKKLEDIRAFIIVE